MNMYQTLKNGDVYFNVNRMIFFFGTTSYITEEAWGYIAILIVNTLGMDNKEETLLYYYQKMVSELKEKNIKFKGYKRKISHVVPTLTRIYGKNTFCWLEISFSLIRSMNSWFSFRNGPIYNPPGQQFSWEFLSKCEEKHPEIDTDELIDMFRKSHTSEMNKYRLTCLTKVLLPTENYRESKIHIPIYQHLSSDDFEEGHKMVPPNRSGNIEMCKNTSCFSYRDKTSTSIELTDNLFPSPPVMALENIKVPMGECSSFKTKINYHDGKAVMMKTPLNKDFISKRSKPVTVYRDTDSQFIQGDYADYLSKQLIFEDTKIIYTEADKNLGRDMFKAVLETEMNKIRPSEEEISF